MSIVLYLPDKRGDYGPVMVPRYIEEILIRRIKGKDIPRMIEIGCYRYRIYGYNPVRPAYGIEKDIEKLNKWTSRYFCPIEDIKIHAERKDYYVDFSLYDPVVHQLEKHGLIRR